MRACRERYCDISVVRDVSDNDERNVGDDTNDVKSTRLCFFEWGQSQSDQNTIFLVHATGFHARCWDQTIAHLEDRHVIAIDMRGHGRSSNVGPFGWLHFGADIVAIIKSLDLNDIVAVGHSMGGHAVIQAMIKMPERFHRSVLVDPVILPPEVYNFDTSKQASFPGLNGKHPVARRRNEFVDELAMYKHLKGRGSYSSWTDECLRDYCRYGLVRNKTGDGYVLACPPTVEASIYGGSSSLDIYEKIGGIHVPVTVLRAYQSDSTGTEIDFSRSPTWADLADCLPRGRDVYLPELTHFMPMQDPKLVADFILDLR